MLVPTEHENRVLSVHHPWLSRLRSISWQFVDDEELVVCLIDQVQSELLMRYRFLWKLCRVEDEAKCNLKYVRFVRDATEADGIPVEAVPSYLDLVHQVERSTNKVLVFEQIIELVIKHGLDHLHAILSEAVKELARKDELISEFMERIRAINEATVRTELAINHARTCAGLPRENIARLDENDTPSQS